MENLRSIECFVRAAEGGSIAAAARRLGITPAAASQNIQRWKRRSARGFCCAPPGGWR